MNTILDFFQSLNSPILQALCAGLFTWILTSLGAALVFFFKGTNRKVLDMALGFTGGVMIAASFWSLIAPAITTNAPGKAAKTDTNLSNLHIL